VIRIIINAGFLVEALIDRILDLENSFPRKRDDAVTRLEIPELLNRLLLHMKRAESLVLLNVQLQNTFWSTKDHRETHKEEWVVAYLITRCFKELGYQLQSTLITADMNLLGLEAEKGIGPGIASLRILNQLNLIDHSAVILRV
jgi:hypothetical protein